MLGLRQQPTKRPAGGLAILPAPSGSWAGFPQANLGNISSVPLQHPTPAPTGEADKELGFLHRIVEGDGDSGCLDSKVLFHTTVLTAFLVPSSEAKLVSEDHTIAKRLSWDLNLYILASVPMSLPLCCTATITTVPVCSH